MKKLAATAICFVLLGHAWGQRAFLYDSAGWKLLDDGSKVTYLRGYLDGAAEGHLMASTMLDNLGPLVPKNPSAEQQRALQGLHNLLQLDVLPESVTVNQIKGSVDTFYGDSRNAPVCWSIATFSAIQSLRGNAPDDKLLDSLRKDGVKVGCK